MLITHKIEQTHFSESEAIIIDYILKVGEEIKNMSINAIAKETYTSAPLLIRIAKKLGFSGWSEFKEAYLKELDYLYNSNDIDASIPFVVSDDFMTIAHHISQLQIETIQDTMKLLDHDQLYHAMRILRDCEEIDLYGVSDKILYAQQFAQQMCFIHKNVHVCSLPADAKMLAAMSHSKHCAILISYSGETDFILRIAKILKKKQTSIIAITCIADNDLSQLADVTLRMSSREMLHTKIGDFATSQSVKCILDIIYGCVFSLDYKNNLNEKIKIAKEIDDRVSGFEYIDEE